MKILHIVNSFFIIRSSDSSTKCLWMDPWSKGANIDGIFPSFAVDYKMLPHPDWIYISHLHDDHYCSELIQKYALSGTKFLIKKFKDSRLKNLILSFGVSGKCVLEVEGMNLIELDKIGLQVCIYPQQLANEDNLYSNSNYDLDTSIAIYDGKEIFYNQVDCSANIEQIQAILAHFGKQIGTDQPVTYYASIYGAGSEYPQCFLGQNRDKIRKTMIKRKANSAFRDAVSINSRIYIPAGASYILGDDRKEMQGFVAVPSKNELLSMWEEFTEQSSGPKQNTILALTEGSNWFSHASINSTTTSDNVYLPIEILKKNQVSALGLNNTTIKASYGLIDAYLISLKERMNSLTKSFNTQKLTISILNVNRVTDKVFKSIEDQGGEDLVYKKSINK